MQTKTISNKLREFRKRAGLRQIDVARMVQLDCADRLSRWENESAMPHVVNLFRLATLYKVPTHELYQGLYDSILCISSDPPQAEGVLRLPTMACEK